MVGEYRVFIDDWKLCTYVKFYKKITSVDKLRNVTVGAVPLNNNNNNSYDTSGRG